MIKTTDGKLGGFEFFLLILFAIGVEATDMTPTFLFKEGKTATWMMPIFSGAVMVIPYLLLLHIMKKFKDKGLTDIVYALTGKYGGFIINMILFYIMFTALVLNSRIYIDIIQVMFFPRTPRAVIYIVFMGSCYFIANRGLEVIGRTARILFPYLMGALILVIIFAFREAKFGLLFPFWGPGVIEIIKSSARSSSTVADVFLIAALFPFARSYKEFKVPVLWGLAASIFILSLFFMFYGAIYDYPTIVGVTFPYQQLIMLASIGRFLTNIESLFFLFWATASIARFTIYLYLAAALFGYSVRLTEFEPLLLPISALTVILGIIPENYIENVFVFRRRLLLSNSWVFFVVLPIILWIVFKLRGEKIK